MKINKCQLINEKVIEFGDINIFVGPNGVGKTTFLNEIREYFGRGDSSKFWVKRLEWDTPSPEDASIIKEHCRQIVEYNDHGDEIIKYSVEHNNNIYGGYDSSAVSNIYEKELYDDLCRLSDGDLSKKLNLPNRFFTHPIYIGHEETGQRLSISGSQAVTDTQHPLKDVYNVMLNNLDFQKEACEAFKNCFHKNLFLSAHRRAEIEILVGEEKDETIIKSFVGKTNDQIKSLKEKNKIFILDRVGDGMRAGAKMIFSLFDPDKLIVFIDEPEAFIHPKQKINLARELKTLSKKRKKQLFFSTHDVSFLFGLLDGVDPSININIFYLKEQGHVIPLPNFNAKDLKIKPGTKQQKYLLSLFHEASIFVEGPNDRCFYENAINYLFASKLSEKDLVFTDTGGASQAIQIVKFVRDSDINAAFIFDKDVLGPNTEKQQKIVEIYSALGGQEDLKAFIESNDFEGAIAVLKKVGVFIVPEGGLESWSAKGIKKDDFPYDVIEEMISKPTKKFMDFVEQIFEYIKF